MSKQKLLVLLVGALVMGLLAACGAAATPETITIVETVEVQKEVKVVETVEVEKVVTKEVEKIVEVEKEGGVQEVKLVARCKASPPYENGRCDNLQKAVGAANAALAEAGDNRRIALETIQDDADWGDYKTEFELASKAGEAPDIIVSGHEHIGDWATAGFIVDITDEIDKYPEFADVIDSLWESTKLNGRIWGVPQDAEARPMYYSKLLLKKLGWSDEEIENLDDRVYAGEFTLQDMFDVAQEAVEKGVVQEGDGWWHRPSNGPDFLYYYYGAGGIVKDPEGSDALVFDKKAALKVYNLFYDAAQVRKIIRPNKLDGDWDFHKEYTSKFDKVMFVFEGTWRWASWHTNYLQDVGGEDYLFENVGFAPIPANEEGTGKPITLTHPLVYMISSQSQAPDLALLLISKATTKELNTDYAVASGHLGILKSQSDYPPYVNAKFLSATLPLLDYTTFLPNSPYWSAYSEAYYLGIQASESGDLTPEEAVETVAEQLKNELGDNVIILE
ncbi:MAG: extracellular solute-binding protein [Chloroflexi bacterium]|nr:MAG: extracellular solute-binding protein [Chloroflexota bacterium]